MHTCNYLLLYITLLAPRKPIGGVVKSAGQSRIHSRPTGSGPKIGSAKTTPPAKVAKSASKPPSGTSAAKSTASASNAAELKALQDEVKQLQDQVSATTSVSLPWLFLLNYVDIICLLSVTMVKHLR